MWNEAEDLAEVDEGWELNSTESTSDWAPAPHSRAVEDTDVDLGWGLEPTEPESSALPSAELSPAIRRPSAQLPASLQPQSVAVHALEVDDGWELELPVRSTPKAVVPVQEDAPVRKKAAPASRKAAKGEARGRRQKRRKKRKPAEERKAEAKRRNAAKRADKAARKAKRDKRGASAQPKSKKKARRKKGEARGSAPTAAARTKVTASKPTASKPSRTGKPKRVVEVSRAREGEERAVASPQPAAGTGPWLRYAVVLIAVVVLAYLFWAH